MKRFLIVSFACLAISGCASAPEAIAPAEVSRLGYSSASCGELGRELNLMNIKYEGLAAQQRSAQTGDAVGVFLIGLPLSSMSGGDREGEIASIKGQQQAIKETMAQRSCKISYSS